MFTRRDALIATLSGAVAAAVSGRVAAGAWGMSGRMWEPGRDDSAATKLGFKLGTQAWTFRDRTTFETLETAKKLGLNFIELYPGQQLSPKAADAKVGYDLSTAQRADLKGAMKDAGITAMAFGVIGPAKDEADIRKHFEFAKGMGLSVITCEPAKDAWELVDKVGSDVGIKAACHNHPKRDNYEYWSPDLVLKIISGRSASVGACADIGHWTRSGIVAVEALKKYEGKLVSLHLKDIREVKGEKIDQPWGTGETDVAGVLRELRRQKFGSGAETGYMSVEYEHGAGPELEENVRKSIAYFDKVCGEIVKAEAAATPKKTDK